MIRRSCAEREGDNSELTRDLECEPLLAVVLLRQFVVGDDSFLVVLIHEVLDDGAGLARRSVIALSKKRIRLKTYFPQH